MNNLFTPNYFRDNFPVWKRKKDPIFLKYFVRPLSFYGASFCAKCGIQANTVSYVSGIVALVACSLFLLPYHVWHIIGAALFTIWIYMDCIDGNLARSVKKQPFGIFADAISSYMLVGFMGGCIGFAAFNEGGLIIDAGNPLLILIGALASSCDTMMRLMYHKYEEAHQDLVKSGVMPNDKDEHTDINNVGNWKIRIEHELGIDGFIPILLLMCTIFQALDIAVIYFICYYGCAFCVTYFTYVRKAIRNSKKFQNKFLEIQNS